MNEELRAELVALFAEHQIHAQAMFAEVRGDRVARNRFAFELPSEQRPSSYTASSELAAKGAVRLAEIVRDVGWPGRSIVGEDGAFAAWAIAQHADEHDDLCQDWLVRLSQAVDAGDADPAHLAALTDRSRLRRGEPQVYGTLIEEVDGVWALRTPVEDPDRLDDRRRTLRLPPIAEYLASLPTPAQLYGAT